MSDIEFIESNNRKSNLAEEMFSREETIKCPHMMALLGYLHHKHGLPKYGMLNGDLRYHYTDAAGLLGIIESSRLWATDLRFLNDPSEGKFLPERTLQFMESKVDGITDPERNVIEGIREALRKPRSNLNAYCVSLSLNGDLLSQWRGYGNFGKGYAVGLELGFNMPHVQIAHFYDVVYGDAGLKELAIDLLDLFVLASNKWTSQMYDEWASSLTVLANSFKDPGYGEEKESRLICFPNTKGDDFYEKELPLKFRAKGGDLIPYIPISLDWLKNDDRPRLPIKRIVVGPGVDFNRNYASIKSLLEANEYNDVEIVCSTIPFRP